MARHFLGTAEGGVDQHDDTDAHPRFAPALMPSFLWT